LATLAPGLRRQLAVLREAALCARHALSAFAPRLRSKPAVRRARPCWRSAFAAPASSTQIRDWKCVHPASFLESYGSPQRSTRCACPVACVNNTDDRLRYSKTYAAVQCIVHGVRRSITTSTRPSRPTR
jgi:hypothetical protein